MATIYLVITNYDWEENTRAFATRDEAIEAIADDFDLSPQMKAETFWREVDESYEAGKWKGLQFLALDTDTLIVTDARPNA